jgi:hypothetical protein
MNETLSQPLNDDPELIAHYDKEFGAPESYLHAEGEGVQNMHPGLLGVDYEVVKGEVVEPSPAGQMAPEADAPATVAPEVTEEKVMSTNDHLASILNTAESDFKPSSLEVAEQIAARLEALNATVKDHVERGTERGKEVDPELAEKLDVVATKGVGNWFMADNEQTTSEGAAEQTLHDTEPSEPAGTHAASFDPEEVEGGGVGERKNTEAKEPTNPSEQPQHIESEPETETEADDEESVDEPQESKPRHRLEVVDSTDTTESPEQIEDIEDETESEPASEPASQPTGKRAATYNEAKDKDLALKGHVGRHAKGRHEREKGPDGTFPLEDSSKPVTEMSKDDRNVYFANLQATTDMQKQEPVRDLSVRSLGSRVKRIFSKADNKLEQIYTTVGNKIVNPFDRDYNEEQKRRAALVVTYAAAAVAVYRTVGALNGFHVGDGGGVAYAAVDHVSQAHQDIAPQATIHQAFDTVKAEPGDNYWNIEVARHPHMSEEHIRERVVEDLHLNHDTWESARTDVVSGEDLKVTRK